METKDQVEMVEDRPTKLFYYQLEDKRISGGEPSPACAFLPNFKP
jgi:hypothetical protein